MSFEQIGLDQAFGFAGLGRWEIEPRSGAMVFDEQCRTLFGVTEEVARSRDAVIARLHIDDREGVIKALENLQAVGDIFEQIFRVRQDSGKYRWIRGVGRLGFHAGQPRILGISMDVTCEQNLLSERELHLAEINHRIKNLFALVSAMISGAARESDSKEDLVQNLRGRVSALDRAHSLMLRTDTSRPLELGDLIESVLSPTLSQQTIVMKGNQVQIPAESVTSLVLILHEWVTNSAKYGALKHRDGEIKVQWHPFDGGVDLTWREKVPDYDPDAEKGFGSHLLQASALQLGASKTRTFEDGWLIIKMRIPLHQVN